MHVVNIVYSFQAQKRINLIQVKTILNNITMKALINNSIELLLASIIVLGVLIPIVNEVFNIL